MVHLETTLFGTLEFPVEEGLFQDVAAVLEGREVSFRLYIWEDLAAEDRRGEILNFLEPLPELYRRAREEMQRGYQTDAVMTYFIEDQVTYLDEARLTACFGAACREDVTAERFIGKLELRGVTIAPREGACGCTLDFSLDPALSDELLVFRFDPALALYDISHES